MSHCGEYFRLLGLCFNKNNKPWWQHSGRNFNYKFCLRVLSKVSTNFILLQERHHSPSLLIHFHNHPLKRLWLTVQHFWSKHVTLHFMDQRKSCCPHVGLIEAFYPARDNTWFLLIGGVWALLPVLGPRLEVLQGIQGGVMGAQWIRHRWFAEGLLEGGLLQLQDEAIGLLTLRFPLLGCLSPYRWQYKSHLSMI